MDKSKIAAEVSNIYNNPESPMEFVNGAPVRSRDEKIKSFLTQLTENHEDIKTIIKEIVSL